MQNGKPRAPETRRGRRQGSWPGLTRLRAEAWFEAVTLDDPSAGEGPAIHDAWQRVNKL